MKKILLIIVLSALILSGCSSGTSYSINNNKLMSHCQYKKVEHVTVGKITHYYVIVNNESKDIKLEIDDSNYNNLLTLEKSNKALNDDKFIYLDIIYNAVSENLNVKGIAINRGDK